jgi:hypothetical protein
MGSFDSFISGDREVQLKAGNCDLAAYNIGDPVEGIEDGAYVAREGVVVISGGKFVAIADKLFTKWGDELNLQEILQPHDYMLREVERIEAKYKDVDPGPRTTKTGFVVPGLLESMGKDAPKPEGENDK